MREHARVVIIGGGIMGCGLLYHLAQEGWTDSLLIEKGELTSGITWHAAGQCPSFIADYNMAKIHHHGNTLYPKLEEMTGQYVSWHGCGGLRFAMNEAELDYFKKVEGTSKLIGFRMQVIGPDEIKSVYPHVDTTGVLAAAWTLDDGHVDPAGCCNALAKGARDMGAEIERRNRVLDVKQLPSGEWQVVTEKGTVTCEHVVNAGGCYARKINQWVGSDVPITNMKHHYLVTEAIQEFIDSDTEMPVIRDPWASSYYRQEQKSGLIGIYETEGAQEAWAERGGYPEWDSENELFTDELDRISPWIEKVLERMEIWGESGIKRIVHGAIPHTPDANPLLGPTGGLKNFWQCCGSSIGIAQGAGCGKYLAQWMVHGESEINMAGLDPRRFGRWADEDYVRARSIEDYEHMYILHLPGEERPAGRGKRESSLYDALKQAGGLYTTASGWERVKYYSPDGRDEEAGFRHNNAFDAVGAECRHVMEKVAVADLSSFAKFEVSGPDAPVLLDRVFANRMPKKVGGIALAHMLNADGMIEGEATVTRLAEDRYYVLSAAAAEVRDMDWLTQHIEPGETVTVENVSNAWGNLVLAGPKSRDVLSQITDADLSNEGFRWLTAQEITVAGVSVRALRVNYIGELGWELHCPMDGMPTVYAALMEAGKAHDIGHFGTYAVNAMRMEKAYRGWGSELTNEITAIEADIERFVKLDKDFLGKAATQQRKQDGPHGKIVYLELEKGDNESVGGEAITIEDGTVIGLTTSGGYGHRTGKSLAFAYVKPDYAAPGTEMTAWLLGAPRKATVLADPVYDSANEKLRA
ncbi:FAD-dependent oxidoreductase [Rhodospirillaceae bacterium KN72]|uniref:FAD-dependent oxidoreductase n=1 Tax=Pacificispira spongiicola TaxID=2729598 RepID=A0A7Y0HEX8_9PROT|nr:FAD-dependent oxidoreductase [Pacificispira spongiicola]NMM45185.1 FAD-dependent oxidoreductase [Pacificispira spongiicola]